MAVTRFRVRVRVRVRVTILHSRRVVMDRHCRSYVTLETSMLIATLKNLNIPYTHCCIMYQRCMGIRWFV